MGAWPVRPLTPRERELGVYVYALIYSWKTWLHRRVEQVEFADPVTYLRRTSIDLTIPLQETPLERTDDRPLFCIPLALLRKSRLRKFSLRDQNGAALPLLTQTKNGAVAVGVLSAAARQVASGLGEDLPAAIYEDLWKIVHQPTKDAIFAWQHFGRYRDAQDANERVWRDALIAHEQFVALTADLARNFLVLTILGVDFGERHIVKFEYEQEAQKPAWVARVWLQKVRRRIGERRRRALDERKALAAIRRGGRTIVRAVAVTRKLDSEGQLSASYSPQPGVELTIRGEGVAVHASTTADGSATFAVPTGTGRLETLLPPGIVEEGTVAGQLVFRPEEEVSIELKYRQVGPAPVPEEAEELGPAITLRRLILNSIAWRARPVVIFAPAVGQALSYHLEVEAPEGLKITRCELIEQASYEEAEAEEPSGRRDFERGPLQRAHVHLGNVAQSSSAVGVVHLRPRASVIVRAGTISALVTAALLWVVARRQTHLLGVLGTVATLLLVVPGGLSAYVARPRENALTSSMVFGLRVLTMATGFISLIAAAAVIFSRDWLVAGNGQIKPGGEWAHADDVLWGCFAGSVVIFVVMTLTWYWTARMPERGPRS
jgi:hypothetical protein